MKISNYSGTVDCSQFKDYLYFFKMSLSFSLLIFFSPLELSVSQEGVQCNNEKADLICFP